MVTTAKTNDTQDESEDIVLDLPGLCYKSQITQKIPYGTKLKGQDFFSTLFDPTRRFNSMYIVQLGHFIMGFIFFYIKNSGYW